jgi:hypothetical protein
MLTGKPMFAPAFASPAACHLIMEWETRCPRLHPRSGVICKARALPGAVIPAQAGIHPQAIGNAPSKGWIPAFAGMTRVAIGVPFQMT